MAWTCVECSSQFETTEKTYPYGLCKKCYFTSDIVKDYRKGLKPKKPDPIWPQIGWNPSAGSDSGDASMDWAYDI